MKLTAELKDRIDRYFEQISADELYDILVNKYGMIEKRGRDSDFGKKFKKLFCKIKNYGLNKQNDR